MPPEWLFVLSRGGGGEPLINMGPKKLFPVVYWRTLTHKVVPCTHTVVVCVVKRGGGTPGKHGVFKVVFQ